MMDVFNEWLGMRSIELELGLYIPYFLLLLTILFLSLLFEKGTRQIKWVSGFLIIVILTLFMGLKPPFSLDLKNYCGIFQDINNGYVVVIEPFFIISSKFFGLFWNNCLAIFLWYALLTAIFLHLAIRKYSLNYIFSIFIFICAPFLFLNAFGVELRQVLALIIFLYGALKLIFERNIRMYIIFSVISFFIHFSVIFAFLFILLFYKIKLLKNRYIILLLYFFSIITILNQEMTLKALSNLYLNLISLVEVPFLLKYSLYFQNISPISWIKYGAYNMLGILHILAFFKLKRVDVKEAKYKNLIILFVYGIIFINLFSFSGPLTRIAFYFQVFQLVTIPYIINKIKPKNIVFIIMVYLYFFQFIYGLNYISPSGYKIFLPYRGYMGGHYELYSE